MEIFNENTQYTEYKISRIGGKLAADWQTVKTDIANINRYLFGFIDVLGLTGVSIETIINAIKTQFSSLRAAYYDKIYNDVKLGIIKKEDYTGAVRMEKLKTLSFTPEQMEKEKRKDITNIRQYAQRKYNKMAENYFGCMNMKDLIPKRNARTFEICREAFNITATEITIDIDKFVRIYLDYLRADESNIKQMQMEAAAAINRFFNGTIEVSERELNRYFIFEDGIMKINPDSVNIQSYSRLGFRSIKINNTDETD